MGSVGTQAWILLMEAEDGLDPLLLQAKQAQRSVLAAYAGHSRYRNQGQRVVAGQRLMQAASDIFLGWQSIAARAAGPTITCASCGTGSTPRRSSGWDRRSCQTTVSCAAGRWPGRTPAPATASPSPATSAVRGKFEQGMADFAVAYADQVNRDYAAFAQAVASGRVAARSGV